MMMRLKKRVIKGSGLVFLSYAMIIFCLVIMISAVNREEVNRLSRNGLYTGNQREFAVFSDITADDWDSVFHRLCETHNHFSIYKTIPDENAYVRGIYTVGEFRGVPMISGNFFDEKSSGSEEPVIVLGKDFSDKAFEKDNELYYYMYGMDFRVIGIMGTQEDSRVNSMILMNFKTAFLLSEDEIRYIADTEKESDMESICSDIAALLPEDTELSMPYHVSKNAIFNANNIVRVLSALSLVSFILGTLVVSVIWFRFRKKMLSVWDMLGIPGGLQLLDLGILYLRASLGGVCGGLTVAGLFNFFVPELGIAWITLLTSSGIAVMISAAMFGVCYCRSMYLKTVG